jgi:NAD(P)-dependent dehydrogenase (short-subunit alcohol dehydrogenase family)
MILFLNLRYSNLPSSIGTDTPMRRAGQPFEMAPAYVYLASEGSTYVTGEILHVNGGSFITS